MSETIIDEIPLSNGLTTETDMTVQNTSVHHEEEETWLYGNNKSKNDTNIDNATAPSIDEITTHEIDAREKATIIPTATSLIHSQLDDNSDDDDDDDGIQITIGNYEPEASSFQTSRQRNRGMLTGAPVIAPKPPTARGVDFDAQGVINGQPTYEHDILNAYRDEEKPWKKPGADIADYFNYGFTEDTWAQYSDRQRRLRSENSLARLNPPHIPPMSPMLSGHPQMMHPMNSHPVMMMNQQLNLQMMTRPMHIRKPDGRIDVIGATDQTSRRQMFETSNNFEHPPFMNGSVFPGGQPPNGQTVGDLISTPAGSNGPPPSHGAPPGGTRHMSPIGVHRLSMMPLPRGMQFRPPFGHPHATGGPQFFPHGPVGGMRGERPPPAYFVSHLPPQSWDKNAGPPLHGFPPGPFPPQVIGPAHSGNGRAPFSQSSTPENHSSRSSTPEENRPSGEDPAASGTGAGGGDNEKPSKDDRYKERYRDNRDYHSSSRRRPSSKDRSSSNHTRHHGSEHEYERPRNDRKSSRDRDDKYERHSRQRHHREDSDRHHRGDDEASHSHRPAHRTSTKNEPSPSKTNLPTPTSTEPSHVVSEQPQSSEPNPTSSPVNRSRRDDSERSSSRHSHHKKSSKRSRHDSDSERNSGHYHRRSKEKSSSSNRKSTNQSDSVSDLKE